MEDRLLAVLSGSHNGVLATIKRDGRPQLSNVGYAFADGVIRISITDGRAKTKNLRRDPRASFHVSGPNFRSYVVAEGTADLTPVATTLNDATNDELVAIYRAIAGEHPDWDEFRTAMIDEHRLVLRIPVDRVYGMA
jgi:PPOX class probable F420-dependent enzyme